MSIQVIISQAGPLPITVNFQAPGNTPMYLEVNGSVWTQSENKMIGIEVQLDGKAIGTAQIFSNLQATHRAVVPAFMKVQFGEGQHTLTLNAAPGTTTVSDLNDLFTAVIHY